MRRTWAKILINPNSVDAGQAPKAEVWEDEKGNLLLSPTSVHYLRDF